LRLTAVLKKNLNQDSQRIWAQAGTAVVKLYVYITKSRKNMFVRGHGSVNRANGRVKRYMHSLSGTSQYFFRGFHARII